MLGSILSNLLLVLGMCFLFGGLRNLRNSDGSGMEQVFPSGTAQTTCSLLALSSASLVIPAAVSPYLPLPFIVTTSLMQLQLYNVLDSQKESINSSPSDPVLLLSRGTAIILLILYVMYLFFQLSTHHNLFDSDIEHEALSEGDAEAQSEEPCMGAVPAAIVLVVTTVIIGVCADYLVASIDNVVETAGISKTFVGLILIPIVGNAAEHVTAVVVAMKNKMDLAMGVAIGSSIQIALLVTPFLVIFGWIIGEPMSLHFETCESRSLIPSGGALPCTNAFFEVSTVAFAFSVLVVTFTVQDGRSNYLEGAMVSYSIQFCRFYIVVTNQRGSFSGCTSSSRWRSTLAPRWKSLVCKRRRVSLVPRSRTL